MVLVNITKCHGMILKPTINCDFTVLILWVILNIFYSNKYCFHLFYFLTNSNFKKCWSKLAVSKTVCIPHLNGSKGRWFKWSVKQSNILVYIPPSTITHIPQPYNIYCLQMRGVENPPATFLTSAANRLIGEVVQSRRRPLLGPSPGWKRLLALSHLRHY